MSSKSANYNASKQIAVDLSSLDGFQGVLATPDSVAAGQLGARIEGSYGASIHQTFNGDVGLNGEELSNLVTLLLDSEANDQETITELAGQMTGSVEAFADKLAAAQQGETGEFAKMLREAGIMIVVVVVAAIIFLKPKRRK